MPVSRLRSLAGAAVIATGLFLSPGGPADASLAPLHDDGAPVDWSLESFSLGFNSAAGDEGGASNGRGYAGKFDQTGNSLIQGGQSAWWTTGLTAGPLVGDTAWESVITTYDASTGLQRIYLDGMLVVLDSPLTPSIGLGKFVTGWANRFAPDLYGPLAGPGVYTTSLTAMQTAVMTLPEPGTLAIMSSCVAGVIVARWWERRAAARRHRRPLKAALSPAQHHWLVATAKLGGD